MGLQKPVCPFLVTHTHAYHQDTYSVTGGVEKWVEYGIRRPVLKLVEFFDPGSKTYPGIIFQRWALIILN